MNWKGVTPAITTPLNENLSVDHAFLAEHSRWLLENGCTGVVALGSRKPGGLHLVSQHFGVDVVGAAR